MNTQMEPSRGHTTDEPQHPTTTHNYNGHDDDDDGEKKSVLKKVKAKAKKIKDTIKGHVGHGHGRDHDDDDGCQDDHPDRQPHPQPYAAPSGGTNGGNVSVLSKGVLEEDIVLEKDPRAPKDVGDGTNPQNYQTKVTDPTGMGSKEVEVSPVLHQLDKMIIQDQPDTRNPNQTSSYGETISSVTAKISEKAAKAKDLVATKLGYTGFPEEHEVEESGGAGYIGEYSRKLAEKLKPGEDAKALSEAITEALPLRKGNEEEASKEDRGVKLGRVTQSEEVQKRLGPFEEPPEENTTSECGKYMVHWMKETTASWLGSSQGSLNDDTVKSSEKGYSNSDREAQH